MSTNRNIREVRNYLDALGVEVLSMRHNRHIVMRCRVHGKEFSMTMSVTPKHGEAAMHCMRRQIRDLVAKAKEDVVGNRR